MEESEFRSTADELKSKKVGEQEVEKKEQDVEQNDAVKGSAGAGSVEGLDLLGNKLLCTSNGSSRPTAVPTPGVTANGAPTQLTIFYGGSVCVFDAIPVEKVHEIMLIATAVAAATKSGDMKSIGANCPTSSPVLTRTPSLLSTASPLASPRAQPYPIQRNSSFCKLQAELPMARRHSLQRFFEKRRDRLVSKNPYPAQSGTQVSENTKANLSSEPPMPQEELQAKAALNLT